MADLDVLARARTRDLSDVVADRHIIVCAASASVLRCWS